MLSTKHLCLFIYRNHSAKYVWNIFWKHRSANSSQLFVWIQCLPYWSESIILYKVAFALIAIPMYSCGFLSYLLFFYFVLISWDFLGRFFFSLVEGGLVKYYGWYTRVCFYMFMLYSFCLIQLDISREDSRMLEIFQCNIFLQ